MELLDYTTSVMLKAENANDLKQKINKKSEKILVKQEIKLCKEYWLKIDSKESLESIREHLK